MLDIKKLRDNFDDVQTSLKKRGYKIDKSLFFSLEDSRKELQINVEKLQAERKKLSSEFGKLKTSGKDTSDLKNTIDQLNVDLESKDSDLQELLTKQNNLMLDMPNIPDSTVPEGTDEDDNKVLSEHGKIISTNNLDHLETTDKKMDSNDDKLTLNVSKQYTKNKADYDFFSDAKELE